MTTATHQFKLTSGPVCEVTALGAKHQKILTTTDKKSASRGGLLNVLKSIIIRIGNVYFDRLDEKEKDAFLFSLVLSIV